MKKTVIIILCLFLLTGFTYLQPISAEDEENIDIPHPWPQFACNAAHTSVSFDSWDYQKYNEVAWELTLRTERGWNRNPVVGNGKLVIGDTEYVRCVDVISGDVVWSVDLSEPCNESCSILGDTVIVPLGSRYLGLSMVDGEIEWYGDSGDGHMSSVAVLKDDDQLYGYFSSYSRSGAVYRIRLDPLGRGWSTACKRAVVSAPGVNDLVGYVGCASHYDIKLLAEGYGGIRENYDKATQYWAQTVAFDRYMIFTASGGEIIALPEMVSGPEIIDVGGWCFHGPSVYGNSMVIGNDDGKLVRFNIKGEIIWETDLPGEITGTTTVMDDKILVPVADSDPEICGVYIVSAEDGELLDKVLLGEGAEAVYQPVIAWNRMFVEYGSNEKYRRRKLVCFGIKPRPAELEPKLRVRDGDFNVSIPWRGETTRQVTLINDGNVDLELMFEGDSFLEATVETLTIPANQTDTLRVKINAGNFRPGQYKGNLSIYIIDGEYGRRNMGFVKANISITEEEEEEDQVEPPLPPTDLTASWNYDHVELDWNEPESGTVVLGYNLFKAEGANPFPKESVNKTTIKDTNTRDDDVEPGITYRYQVVSVSAGQLFSDPSESVSIEIPIQLEAVTNLTAEKSGDDIFLLWVSDQPVEFKIECNGEEIGRTSEKMFEHKDPPLTQLIYKVFPVTGNTTGPEAFVIFENTPESVDPVSDLKYQIIGDSVLLVWTHPMKAKYEVRRNGDLLGETEELYYKDNNPPKKKLSYSITAKVGTVTSESVSIEVNLAPPLIEIKGLNTDVAENSILLYWQGRQDGVEFVILRNGDKIGQTKDSFFTDVSFPKDELLVYTVYPIRDGEEGIKKTVEVDLRPQRVEVVFTIGKPTARVNGIEMDCKGTPFVSSAGRSLVPFRFLGESIGAEVGYTTGESGAVETVSYIMGGSIIILTIGSKIADVNGKQIELDEGPMIREGRTYVPLRFVTEALGVKVEWDSLTRSAKITFEQ